MSRRLINQWSLMNRQIRISRNLTYPIRKRTKLTMTRYMAILFLGTLGLGSRVTSTVTETPPL